jgi:uncharacterized protein (TIGR00296 family)
MNSESSQEKIESTIDHCIFCFDVLQAALNGEVKGRKGFPPLPESIPKILAPLFVTWHINKDELRGCIGTFDKASIEKNLPRYAYISAFEDDRFDPISKKEFPYLSCSVSLLTNFEKGKDALDWEVGVHGITIELVEKNVSYDATFLPEVAHEQRWTKEETLTHLLRKAGYSGKLKDVQSKIKLERYQSSKCELSYQEYFELKSKK